jgi:hypothetical protein
MLNLNMNKCVKMAIVRGGKRILGKNLNIYGGLNKLTAVKFNQIKSFSILNKNVDNNDENNVSDKNLNQNLEEKVDLCNSDIPMFASGSEASNTEAGQHEHVGDVQINCKILFF